MDLLERCQFLNASADDLSSITTDATIDMITTRSVLIYVLAKQQAFNKFYRTLKPDGRLSIFEPINRFSSPEPRDRFGPYDAKPIMEIAEKVSTAPRAKRPRAA